MDASLVSTRFRSRTCWISRTWTIPINEYPRRASSGVRRTTWRRFSMCLVVRRWRLPRGGTRFHRRWRISESYLRWSFDNSLFDENRPVVRKSVTTYPTTILLSAAIRTNEELATHLLSFVNAHTMNWKSKAKVTQSILVAINRLLNNRQLFDFAGPSKTTRIFVIELEALQSMWRGR